MMFWRELHELKGRYYILAISHRWSAGSSNAEQLLFIGLSQMSLSRVVMMA